MKEFKRLVLEAMLVGHLSKDEAKKLIQSNGEIVLNLSNSGGDDMNEEIYEIMKKASDLIPYFKRVISLGEGIKP